MFKSAKKILKRLFNKEEVIYKTSSKKFKSPIKVLIDNGHGVNTLGKRSPYSCTGIYPKIDFYEYKWNREIANRVVNKLKDKNYDVELLVTEEKDITLSERVNRVNEHCNNFGKDNVMLVSIHANAAGNGSKWENAHGWEAYTSVGKTKSDYIASFFYRNAEKIFKDRKIRYEWEDGDEDKELNFYILKYTKCPAIITENFFYDNISDVEFILSEEGKEKVVDLHVKSIEDYLNDR
jgi:N-acetylmuramoyl-L-alanine amidase